MPRKPNNLDEIIERLESQFGSALIAALGDDPSFPDSPRSAGIPTRMRGLFARTTQNPPSSANDVLRAFAEQKALTKNHVGLPWLAQRYAEGKFCWSDLSIIRSLLASYSKLDPGFQSLQNFSSVRALADALYVHLHPPHSLRDEISHLNSALRVQLLDRLATSPPYREKWLCAFGEGLIVSNLPSHETKTLQPKLDELVALWTAGTAWSDLNTKFIDETSSKVASRDSLYFLLPDNSRLKLTHLPFGRKSSPLLLREDGSLADFEILAPFCRQLARRGSPLQFALESAIDLSYIPYCLQNNSLLKISYEFSSLIPLRHIAPHLLTAETCYSFVQRYPIGISEVPRRFQTVELLKIAVKKSSYALSEIAEDLRSADVCLEAVRGDGLALSGVPREQRTFELCRIAVQNNGASLRYVPEEIMTHELCLDAIHNHGPAFRFTPPELQSPALCLLAVTQNSHNFSLVPSKLRTPELWEAWAIKRQAAGHSPERIEADRIRLLAMEENPLDWEHSPSGGVRFRGDRLFDMDRPWDDWTPVFNPEAEKKKLSYPGSDGSLPRNILRAHPALVALDNPPEWFAACENALERVRDITEVATILHDHGICAEPRGTDIATLEPSNNLAFLGYRDEKGQNLWLCQRAIPLMPEPQRASFLQDWSKNGGIVIWLPLKPEHVYANQKTKIFGRAIHEMRLEEFVRSPNPRVLGEQNFGRYERDLIETLPTKLARSDCWRPQNDWEAPAGYRFFSSPQNSGLYSSSVIAIREQLTGRLVAGIYHGTTWVDPTSRGKGLGRSLVEYGHLYGCLSPSHFSVDGFRARLSAHKHALLAARARGEALKPEVLTDYAETSEGGLVLSNPKWAKIISEAITAPKGAYRTSYRHPEPSDTKAARETKNRRREKRFENDENDAEDAFGFDVDEGQEHLDDDYSDLFGALNWPVHSKTPSLYPPDLSVQVEPSRPAPKVISATRIKTVPLPDSSPENSNLRLHLTPMRQPDGISCGATAVAMVLHALGLLPKGGIADAKRLIRTNPITGTIPWAVIDGLNNIGVAAQHHRAPEARHASESHLQSLLEDGSGQNFVMMRLLIGHMGKHWIVAEKDGVSNEVRFIDPASGQVSLFKRGDRRYSWIFESWIRRDCEAITISADPRKHTAKAPPLSASIIEPASGMVHPTERSLQGWLLNGQQPILMSDARYAAMHQSLLQNIEAEIEKLSKDPYLGEINAKGIKNDHATFYVVGGPGRLESLLVKEASAPVGAIIDGLNYVIPSHRNRGFGTDMLLMAAENPYFRFLDASCYSISGLGARLAAHRRSVAFAAQMSGNLSPLGAVDYQATSEGIVLHGTRWQEISNLMRQADLHDIPIQLSETRGDPNVSVGYTPSPP